MTTATIDKKLAVGAVRQHLLWDAKSDPIKAGGGCPGVGETCDIHIRCCPGLVCHNFGFFLGCEYPS